MATPITGGQIWKSLPPDVQDIIRKGIKEGKNNQALNNDLKNTGVRIGGPPGDKTIKRTDASGTVQEKLRIDNRSSLPESRDGDSTRDDEDDRRSRNQDDRERDDERPTIAARRSVENGAKAGAQPSPQSPVETMNTDDDAAADDQPASRVDEGAGGKRAKKEDQSAPRAPPSESGVAVESQLYARLRTMELALKTHVAKLGQDSGSTATNLADNSISDVPKIPVRFEQYQQPGRPPVNMFVTVNRKESLPEDIKKQFTGTQWPTNEDMAPIKQEVEKFVEGMKKNAKLKAIHRSSRIMTTYISAMNFFVKLLANSRNYDFDPLALVRDSLTDMTYVNKVLEDMSLDPKGRDSLSSAIRDLVKAMVEVFPQKHQAFTDLKTALQKPMNFDKFHAFIIQMIQLLTDDIVIGVRALTRGLVSGGLDDQIMKEMNSLQDQVNSGNRTHKTTIANMKADLERKAADISEKEKTISNLTQNAEEQRIRILKTDRRYFDVVQSLMQAMTKVQSQLTRASQNPQSTSAFSEQFDQRVVAQDYDKPDSDMDEQDSEGEGI